MSLKGNCPGGIRANNFSSKKGYKTYTQYKSLLNLVNLIQIWMVTTLLWLIQNQTYFFAQCSETYAKTVFRFLLHFSLNKILILSFWDLEIVQQQFSTKNVVLLWFCLNSDLHTFPEILRKLKKIAKKNSRKNIRQFFFLELFETYAINFDHICFAYISDDSKKKYFSVVFCRELKLE